MSSSGGSKKGGSKQQVSDYYMSIWYGFCLEADSIVDVLINDKSINLNTANFSEQSSNGYQDIRDDGLFGGPKEGGGVNGRIHTLFGGSTQLLPAALAGRLEVSSGVMGTPTTVPGARGYVSLFFTGKDAVHNWSRNSKAGFIWGANYPSLPGVKARFRRRPKGLDDNGLIIDSSDPANPRHNANPAHIVWECLTSTKFGLGMAEASLDRASFLTAAQTLRDEEFGLSAVWDDRFGTVEEFVNWILAHINGMLFQSIRTGKMTLRLLRNDYDVDDLQVIGPDDAVLTDYERIGWGETTNSIEANWTNPKNEKQESVTAQHNANIEIQGQEVPDTRDYTAVRNSKLANKLALREALAAGMATASGSLTVDRRKYDVEPGKVYKFVWPELGIVSMPIRAQQVRLGPPGNPIVSFSFIQDLWGIPFSEFGQQATKWKNPSSKATAVDKLFLGAAPYFVVAQLNGDEYSRQLEYPDAYTLILSGQDKEDVRTTDVLAEGVDIVGNVGFRSVTIVNNQGHGRITSTMSQEVKTDIFPLTDYFGNRPQPGAVIMLFDETDPTIHELAAVESSSASEIIVRRGVLDTIPLDWPLGAGIWLIDTETRTVDPVLRSVGETVKYKLLPITSNNRLSSEDAPITSATIDDRLYMPYRPANVQVNGHDFFSTVVIQDPNLAVTWSNRNRLTETGTVFAWNDATITPEDGQTTTVQIIQAGTVLLDAHGITGAEFVVPIADIPGLSLDVAATIRVFSVRDGYESRNKVDQIVYFNDETTVGYGTSYGYRYGL